VRRSVAIVSASLLLATAGACRSAVDPTQRQASVQTTVLVIAHRGASGHRPEHTIEGYALAIAMGADYIEPDLVATQDGVLVARHENDISGTTDVAVKFPTRKRRKVIDGDTITGWFTEDFSLAELRTLRAKERLAFRSHALDGQFAIPTFDEVLALADSAGRRRGRPVGVYPELKHPTYFRSIGLPLEYRLLASLDAKGLNRREAPVFIQCFETAPLRALRAITKVRLVQLLSGGERPYDFVEARDARTGSDLATPAGLKEIARYADAIGVNTRMVVGADPSARPSSLIRDAHAAGLRVHVWTLRPEPNFLAARYHGDPLEEVRELASLGVDGMFGDYPDVVVKGLNRAR
jgi:glycerophosphoryl diester phosphodiesterase